MYLDPTSIFATNFFSTNSCKTFIWRKAMDESKHKERNRENKKREREREEKQHNDEKNPRMIPKRKENNLTREDAELKDEEEQRRLGEEIQKRRRRAQELLEYFMRKNEEANLVMNYGVEELEINDFPQNARWRLTRKETFPQKLSLPSLVSYENLVDGKTKPLSISQS
ncbi:hypothetical protein CMV_026693 [Castanea mollissima]|uniref:Uncharacterized protein n=1 Tax=Castanea mollissima TaxID=60419 RepID=A0A8J4QBH5_9ROSI|nr:hypothetical protein CMV_026693 [Castanea mollissima]